MAKNIEVLITGDLVRVTLPNQILVEEAMILRETLIPYIEKGYFFIMCEFSNVTNIDSSGLGALVAINKRLLHLDGQLILKNVSGKVRELFELTRLSNEFHLH